MKYNELRIPAAEWMRSVTDPALQQNILDNVSQFAAAHGICFYLLDEELIEITARMQGKDAAIFAVEKTANYQSNQLQILIADGALCEIYGTYNEYGEILPNHTASTMIH